MTYCNKTTSLLIVMILLAFSLTAQNKQARFWLTTADRTFLFQLQPTTLAFKKQSNDLPTVTVDESTSYQTIDGFGFALTGGSAQHMIKMSPAARKELIKELFTTEKNNIGLSYLRVSIGASDLNEKVFSYDDLPEGETDIELKKFELGPDRLDVIPVLKEILAVAPGIKILASPWSPPAWMKTIFDTRGGRLQPAFYRTYAAYFVKYIQGMKKAGITIDAVTVQNEPLHPGNNPSLLMPAPDEAEFIKNHLGPAFKAAGLTTKIILYDHNADRPDYPIYILDDAAAAKFIDGSGFHLYGGDIEALSDVHNAHPNKNLYFTEQMVVDRPGATGINIAWPIKNVMIGATRNWCKNVLLWNLAADPEFKPFTDRGGCNSCQGAVTINKDIVTRNHAYYVMAHVSKFVRPGSKRIASNNLDAVSTVAFKTSVGTKVLLAVNNSKSTQTFNILFKGEMITTSLKAGAVATYNW
ncbi:MAG: glycoside hydrolase family 30 beta sandwich domain-containing protein [Ferruginibacter sp.]